MPRKIGPYQQSSMGKSLARENAERLWADLTRAPTEQDKAAALKPAGIKRQTEVRR